jgi:hypothetical protein
MTKRSTYKRSRNLRSRNRSFKKRNTLRRRKNSRKQTLRNKRNKRKNRNYKKSRRKSRQMGGFLLRNATSISVTYIPGEFPMVYKVAWTVDDVEYSTKKRYSDFLALKDSIINKLHARSITSSNFNNITFPSKFVSMHILSISGQEKIKSMGDKRADELSVWINGAFSIFKALRSPDENAYETKSDVIRIFMEWLPSPPPPVISK